MGVKKFFVNSGQANVGPFDMKTIIEKVEKNELKATDRLCVNTDNDEWVLICQHQDFIDHYAAASRASKPPKVEKAPVMPTHAPSDFEMPRDIVSPAPVAKTAPVIASPNAALPTIQEIGDEGLKTAQWFLLKGKNRFGPFTYPDVIRMLQEKSVFEYEYVWCQGLEKWKRIAELAIFGHDAIRNLYNGQAADVHVFYRRNFPRSKYETGVICHDNNKIWRGKSMEISEGGAGVVIENAMIVPGQNVYLHFKAGPQTKSFNVLCEVVFKQYLSHVRDNTSPILYGIKFININKQDREFLRLIHGAA